MSDNAQTFIKQFRGTDKLLSDSEREQLLGEGFHRAVCRALYMANNPSDRSLIVQLMREEMRLRRDDESEDGHDGDRLILCALLLALLRDVSDVPLLWEAKHLDFDMGCYFDSELFVFGGLAATLEYLRRQPDEASKEAIGYLEVCQTHGYFNDMDRYLNHKLTYFSLPFDRAV